MNKAARNAVWMAALASLCAIAPAQTIPLADQIAAILAAPTVARDHWGIQVTTLEGSPIYSLNEAQLFLPASNAKLFTTAAALALLGPDKTFETKVVGVFDPASNMVTSDLVIVGSGDANLSGRSLPYGAPTTPSQTPSKRDPLHYLEELADQIAAKGIKSVTGDIVGDDTLFPWEPYAIGWDMDDAVWGYGAPVSALTVEDNELPLTVAHGTITGPEGRETYHNGSAVLDQDGVPYYTVESQVDVTTGKYPGGVQVERAPGSRVLRVYGQMAQNAAPDVEKIAIADPAEYTAMAFKGMLEARGIAVHGSARAKHVMPRGPFDFTVALHASTGHCEDVTVAGGECAGDCSFATEPGSVLAAHTSVPLAQDVVVTNKVSQNLHSELLLHQLGRRVTCGDGSTVGGARLVRSFLIKRAAIDGSDFVFYDGSGLSTHDLVTPRAIAKLLSYAAHDPKTAQPQSWFAVWKSSLPVGGVDGTLDDRFTRPPLKGHVFAKTGTLGEARALSGYLDGASGRTLIFSILVGDHLPGTSDDREAMDRIVAAIQASE